MCAYKISNVYRKSYWKIHTKPPSIDRFRGEIGIESKEALTFTSSFLALLKGNLVLFFFFKKKIHFKIQKGRGEEEERRQLYFLLYTFVLVEFERKGEKEESKKEREPSKWKNTSISSLLHAPQPALGMEPATQVFALARESNQDPLVHRLML